jgi:hypothetical protein
MATQVAESSKQFLGVEAFPDLTTVQALTPPPGTNFVMLQARGNWIIWTPDASTPAVGNGFHALPTETVCIHQDTPEDIRLIQGSAGASAFVAYYR